MNAIIKNLISTLIGLALLAAGIAGALYFVKTKPQPQLRPQMSSMIPVVETAPFTSTKQALKIECLGTVIADKTAAIQPEVTGRIVSTNPSLVEGKLVKKGDMLVEIDDTDYCIDLLNAEADLMTAQSTYRIEEGQQDVVRHELKLMGESKESEDYRDLLLREPQLKSAEAALKSAQAAKQRAELNLKRTKIYAPFDAIVTTTDADVGDYAQPSTTLLELAATDRYFIRASIPLSSLQALPRINSHSYDAVVTLSDGSQRKAESYKLLPDLTEKGRMARLLLSVDNPYGSEAERPLLLNEYVRTTITGKAVENVSLIKRKYLRDGNVLWMIDSEDKLHIVKAEVIQGYADDVLVRIEDQKNMELVITDLSAAVDGMQLRKLGAEDNKLKAPKEHRPPESGIPQDKKQENENKPADPLNPELQQRNSK